MLSLRGGFDICKKRDHYRYWSRFFRHGWTVRSLVAVAIWVGFVSFVTGMFSGVKLLVPHVALLWDISVGVQEGEGRARSYCWLHCWTFLLQLSFVTAKLEWF